VFFRNSLFKTFIRNYLDVIDEPCCGIFADDVRRVSWNINAEIRWGWVDPDRLLWSRRSSRRSTRQRGPGNTGQFWTTNRLRLSWFRCIACSTTTRKHSKYSSLRNPDRQMISSIWW